MKIKDEKIKVKFLGINGYDCDLNRAKEILSENKVYKLVDLDIDTWNSEIWLKGFNESFNSVMFKYYKNGKEIDIVEEYKEKFGY